MVLVPGFAGGRAGTNASAPGEKIGIMIALWSPEAPASDTPVWAALEKLTGEKLDLQFVPSDSYTDKLNVSIAAGELPHSFCILDNKGNSFVSAARGGMFWELGTALKNSLNLSKSLDSKVLANGAIDGKNYFIPRTRVTTRSAYNYRKDWLEKLGLQPPQDLNGVYNIIKAFATRDPDGNGKNDTYGLITAAADDGLWGFNIPAVTNGAGNGWIEENGQLVPAFTTGSYFETVQFFKRLYDEKLINQDFATIRQEKGFELLNAEQGGMFFGNSDEIWNRFDPLVSAKKAVNPNIKLEDLWDFNAQVKSPDGSIRIPGGVGFYGGFVFPKTTLKNETDFQRVFSLFDKLDSDEGRNLMEWGVEGINYTISNGVAQQINPATYTKDVTTFFQLAMSCKTNPGSLKIVQLPIFEKVNSDQIANQKYGVMDLTYPYISQTYVTRNAELRKIIADATIQYIMGQINEAGYWAAVDRWKASGGQQIINEYTQAYKASR
jgi:putative aldouronate transport system substrate-binding protein